MVVCEDIYDVCFSPRRAVLWFRGWLPNRIELNSKQRVMCSAILMESFKFQ